MTWSLFGLSTKLKCLPLRGGILFGVNFKLNQPVLTCVSNSWCWYFLSKLLMAHRFLSRQTFPWNSVKNRTVFTFPTHTELGADCRRNGLCYTEESCSSGHLCVLTRSYRLWSSASRRSTSLQLLLKWLKQLHTLIIDVTEVLPGVLLSCFNWFLRHSWI